MHYNLILSNTILILQTEIGVLDFFQSRVKTTTSVGEKTFDWSTIFRTVFWLVRKSQWITLTPKWIYY